jgi:hypothetical protein
MGRAEEALETLQRLPVTEQTGYVRSVLAPALAAAGRRQEAETMCAALERDLAEGRAGPIHPVPVMARLGREEEALALLREGVRRREPFIPWLACEERYDPLRDLPGFRELLRELRLEREFDGGESEEL